MFFKAGSGVWWQARAPLLATRRRDSAARSPLIRRDHGHRGHYRVWTKNNSYFDFLNFFASYWCNTTWVSLKFVNFFPHPGVVILIRTVNFVVFLHKTHLPISLQCGWPQKCLPWNGAVTLVLMDKLIVHYFHDISFNRLKCLWIFCLRNIIFLGQNSYKNRLIIPRIFNHFEQRVPLFDTWVSSFLRNQTFQPFFPPPRASHRNVSQMCSLLGQNTKLYTTISPIL